MPKLSVLVVDARKETFDQIIEALSSQYEVNYLPDALELMCTLEGNRPDLIILDVDGDKGNGFAMCSELKNGYEFDDIPIVIISSTNTFESRIKGYEAGAEEFIQKPFLNEELLARLQAVVRYINTVVELKEKADNAMQAVMSIITSSGEMAYVVDFLRSSYKCNEVDELGDCITQTSDDYGLNVLVRLATDSNTIFKGNSSEGTPLERSLFDHLPKDVRIHAFGNRCVFNYGGATILVKNMPSEDEGKCGRIRDNLAIVAEGASAALKSITAAKNVLQKKKDLQELLERSCDILDLIKTKTLEQRLASAKIMSELIEEFELNFMRLGLTETQEAELIAIVKKSDQRQSILFEVGDALEGHLTQLLFGFEKALRASE